MKHRLLSSALGLLLLCAAAMKLFGFQVSALPSARWFSAPWVQIGAAEWELVLGIWLLSGKCRLGAWLAAIATFAGFASVSVYLGSIGHARCGCFGPLQASPWHALAIDGAVLALLLIFRLDFRSNNLRFSRTSLLLPAGTAVAMIVITGIGAIAYGSPEAALARLRGETLTTSSDYVDFGSGSAPQQLDATVEIRNWSSESVRLVGGTTDCTCVTTANLPLAIPPGESRTIALRLKIPLNSSTGTFSRVAELWTDNANQPRIRLRLGCRVLE